jgi:3-oxoacyl-[acyl-carrier protein] reductase
VDTELVDEFFQNRSRTEVSKGIPIRRLAECREIADVAVFLASDLASYMVGETVIVDGGLTIP